MRLAATVRTGLPKKLFRLQVAVQNNRLTFPGNTKVSGHHNMDRYSYHVYSGTGYFYGINHLSTRTAVRISPCVKPYLSPASMLSYSALRRVAAHIKNLEARLLGAWF